MIRASRDSSTAMVWRTAGGWSGTGEVMRPGAVAGGPVSIRATMDFGIVKVLSPMAYSTCPFFSVTESATMRVPCFSTIVSAKAAVPSRVAQQNVIISRNVYVEHYGTAMSHRFLNSVTKVLLLALILTGVCLKAQEVQPPPPPPSPYIAPAGPAVTLYRDLINPVLDPADV